MRYILSVIGLMAALAMQWASAVEVKSVEVHQRYPWNGLVDIVVTLEGLADDVSSAMCLFVATNCATGAAVPIASVTRNGSDVGSGNSWTRRYIWNAANDVGNVKIDDLALTVEASCGVQLWENGPYWAECNVGATKPEDYGYYFWWGDTVGYKRNASNNGWVSVKNGSAFPSQKVIARPTINPIHSCNRLDTSTRQAISWRRMTRRRCISARPGGCRRTRNFLRSSAIAIRHGQCAMACMVVWLKAGALIRRRVSFFQLQATASIPASTTPARPVTSGPLRRIRTTRTTHGACTSIRATSISTTTAATAGSLFVRSEDLPNSARIARVSDSF